MRSDLLGGGLICLIGGAVGLAALGSPLGSAAEMGPGYFPFALSVLLAILGLLIMFGGRASGEPQPTLSIPWKGVAIVLGAPLLFLLIVHTLGLAISVFVVSFLASLASKDVRIVPSLLFSAALGVACALIFGVGLNLDLPVFGTLFGHI